MPFTPTPYLSTQETTSQGTIDAAGNSVGNFGLPAGARGDGGMTTMLAMLFVVLMFAVVASMRGGQSRQRAREPSPADGKPAAVRGDNNDNNQPPPPGPVM